MNSIFDWLRNSTHTITEAVRQIVLWAIGVGIITHDFQGRPWDETQTVLTVSAVSAVLAVIAAKTTVSANKAQERIASARAEGVELGNAQASSGTGSGMRG